MLSWCFHGVFLRFNVNQGSKGCPIPINRARLWSTWPRDGSLAERAGTRLDPRPEAACGVDMRSAFVRRSPLKW